jgi:oligogalacturonide lyase
VQTRLASGKGQQYPSERLRYADPLTEREVWRLTGSGRNFHYPAPYQKFAAKNNSFAIVGGAFSGEPQVFRIDLPSGKLTQLTQGSGVATHSTALAPDERSIFFLEGAALKQLVLRSLREREIYRVEDGWLATGDMSLSIDGRYVALVEMQSSDRVDPAVQFERKPLCRIRVVETFKGKNWIFTEEKAWLGRPQLRPRRDQVLYCQLGPWELLSARMWLVNLDGKQRRNVRPRVGEEQLGPEYWTDDGKLIGYAHYPDAARHRATMRTFDPDTRQEEVLARCTQFWEARGNSDNSAIAGASLSKAGPNVYVLFPATEREQTVCEHASSGKPGSEPRPVFSPDSQWIYFTSDRRGSMAVYRAGVGDLVEKT